MSGETPTQFNEEPDAGSQALVEGIAKEVLMSINWKDFAVHFGVQVVTAAATAAVTAISGYDYSSLGVIGPMIQGAAALGATAFNTWMSDEKKKVLAAAATPGAVVTAPGAPSLVTPSK